LDDLLNQTSVLVLFVLVFWGFGALDYSFEINCTVMLALASFFQINAEIFLVVGISVGIVGCVAAVVASNFVYVSILSSIFWFTTLNSDLIGRSSQPVRSSNCDSWLYFRCSLLQLESKLV